MRRVSVLAVAFALVFASFALAPGRAAAAPLSWVYNGVTHHYYAQVSGVTWVDAEALAAKLGGHLATVDDQAENDWLMATFPDSWLWIGLNDRAVEGTWVWSSGKKVDFTNWAAFQPDDWAGFDPVGEDAAVLSANGEPGWIDISEHWLGAGLIELPGRPRDLTTNQLPVGTHDGSEAGVAYGAECYANGWAWDPDSGKRDVTVRILATRQDVGIIVPKLVWTGTANGVRQDVADAGAGDLTSGFDVYLGGLLEWGLPYEIRVQARDLQTGEWTTLDASPRFITCLPQP
jgi:hypothetical protein